MPAPLATRIRDKLRSLVVTLRRQYLIRVWRMHIGDGTIVSFSARLDKANPRGIHIGKYTVVTFGAAVLTHDHVNSRDRDVYIGYNWFISARSISFPGVSIRNHCIMWAAGVVVWGVVRV